ncbi:MAG: UPF0489 family protein [Candidatus Omnitrophica bacterium]|nr:UPF0489 family protein [Candidatus Omnitrophota bacterium]
MRRDVDYIPLLRLKGNLLEGKHFVQLADIFFLLLKFGVLPFASPDAMEIDDREERWLPLSGEKEKITLDVDMEDEKSGASLLFDLIESVGKPDYTLSRKEKDKILITGGLGHLGIMVLSQLLDYPVAEDITVLTSRVDYLSDLPLNRSLSRAVKEGRVKIVHCDLTDYASTEKVLSMVRPSFIYHLASDSRIQNSYSEDEFRSIFSNNIAMAFNILDALKNLNLMKTTRLVFTSSLRVYGKRETVEKVGECDCWYNLEHPYELSKIIIENAIAGRVHYSGLRAVVLRLGNLFPLFKKGKPIDIVSKFIKNILEGSFLKMPPNANALYYNFIPLWDCAALAASLIKEFEGSMPCFVNVVGENYSLGDLSNKIKQIVDPKNEKVLRIDDVHPELDTSATGKSRFVSTKLEGLRKIGFIWNPTPIVESLGMAKDIVIVRTSFEKNPISISICRQGERRCLTEGNFSAAQIFGELDRLVENAFREWHIKSSGVNTSFDIKDYKDIPIAEIKNGRTIRHAAFEYIDEDSGGNSGDTTFNSNGGASSAVLKGPSFPNNLETVSKSIGIVGRIRWGASSAAEDRGLFQHSSGSAIACSGSRLALIKDVDLSEAGADAKRIDRNRLWSSLLYPACFRSELFWAQAINNGSYKIFRIKTLSQVLLLQTEETLHLMYRRKLLLARKEIGQPTCLVIRGYAKDKNGDVVDLSGMIVDYSENNGVLYLYRYLCMAGGMSIRLVFNSRDTIFNSDEGASSAVLKEPSFPNNSETVSKSIGTVGKLTSGASSATEDRGHFQRNSSSAIKKEGNGPEVAVVDEVSHTFLPVKLAPMMQCFDRVILRGVKMINDGLWLVVDHGQMYNVVIEYLLKSRISRGATLIHFDAHSDLSMPSRIYGLGQNTIQNWWSEYDCASMIMPLFYHGVISRMYWIVPHYMNPAKEQKNVRKLLIKARRQNRGLIPDVRVIHVYDLPYFSDLKDYPDIILDFDIDYFLLNNCYIDPAFRILSSCGNRERFNDILNERIVTAIKILFERTRFSQKLTVIAQSPEYTHQDYIIPIQEALLSEIGKHSYKSSSAVSMKGNSNENLNYGCLLNTFSQSYAFGFGQMPYWLRRRWWLN